MTPKKTPTGAVSTEHVSIVSKRQILCSHSKTVILSNSRAKADEKTEHHLNPLKVLHCVDELMAEDSIIVADGGDFVGSAAYIMRPRGPMRWLDPGKNTAANWPFCLNT